MTKELLDRYLKEAYRMGQVFWQQADSGFVSQNKKADVTKAKFDQLLIDAGEALAQQEPSSDSADFKNFHEQLCKRFGYTHDTVDWRRDQVSLIEHIAKAQQEKPAQKVTESWTDIVAVNLVREGVNKHKARELAAHFLTLFAPPTQPSQEPVAWYLSEDSNILGVEWSRQKPKYGRDWTPLYKTAPTHPALSDDEILNCFYASKSEGMASYMLAVGRAIEAHCRGGAS